MNFAQDSANEETKSSSGDKYETGRAMAQLEIEKSTEQLNEALKQKKILDSLQIKIQSEEVLPGSLAITSQGNFFIAISVGMVSVNGKNFGVVSAESPIGLKLLGQKKGSTFTFNNKSYRVDEVL